MSGIRTLAATACAGLLLALTGCGSDPNRWEEGSTHGQWQVVYTGYGLVKGTDERVWIQPTAAQEPDNTHAGLVTTATTEPIAHFEIDVRTEKQLRNPTPNPWEVAWALWSYQDNEHFYAVLLKPTGWEISKQDPAYRGGQRFLASGHLPKFPIGQWHHVEVHQAGNTSTVRVNGAHLATVKDDERPYEPAAVGLYTEDADVEFSNFIVRDLTSSAP